MAYSPPPPTGFTKLYGPHLLLSSLWGLSTDTRIVWITLLCMADAEGRVMAAPQGVANSANVPLAKCRDALKIFLSPDKDSRTQEFDGRRIERIEGGFRILNYAKYRDLRSKKQVDAAERQQRFRQKQRGFSA